MKQGAPLKRTEFKRGKPLARKSGLKSRPRKRLTKVERDQAAEFKAAVADHPCAMCGCPPWLTRMHAHHVIYKQHLPRNHWYDPDGALQLCADCHERHHSRSRPVFKEALRDRNLEFASRVLKAAAGSYFARYYA